MRAASNLVILLNVVLIFLFVFVLPGSAAKLLDNQKFVVLASRRNIDEAIGVARRYFNTKVYASKNNWFAVLIGPVDIPIGKEKEYLVDITKKQGLPNDAFLSNGDGLLSEEWRSSQPEFLKSLEFDGKNDADFQFDDLRIHVSKAPTSEEGMWLPQATGYIAGKVAFTLKLSVKISGSDAPKATLSTLWLDRESPRPQLVFSYYWQGAHCCTVTKIATQSADGAWSVVDGDALDGEGYGFEKLDDSGTSFLISVDQNFLYAFAPYANSYAPIRIQRLRGMELVDITRSAISARRLAQSYYGILPDKEDDPAWHDNGFLSAWVAYSILMGNGHDAWNRILRDYDREPTFGGAYDRCTVDLPVEKCPSEKITQIPFPPALRKFLIEHAYISNVDDYPIPADKPDVSVSAAPVDSNMTTCVQSLETLKKLILRAFARRTLPSEDQYDVIRFKSDTTVDAFDPNTSKVSCSVSYNLNLKQFASKLLDNNQFDVAKGMISLARKFGQNASARVRFTVKPTQTPGTTWVELLP